MKTHVYGLDGKSAGEIELPALFSANVRADVIKRAVLAQQSARRQPYGSDPLAGKRTSAHYHGSRHYRFTMMNKEMSRIPRIHGKVGYMVWTARFAPHAVKGRRAHPPKAEKIWLQKVNVKERQLAILSALAASADIKLVSMKHKVERSPIIIVNDFENTKKTKDVVSVLSKIMNKELKRCNTRKVRAGKGKLRGRKYEKKRGPLVITSKNCSLLKAARNISGVDAVSVNNLNAELLAPGAHPGRAVVTTKAALKEMEKKFGE
ncbi:50S ribosomal protein L4 [archaeon]|nr:50S ribosomal protein L4 [archaeon]